MHNLKSAWPTKFLMSFLSSLDDFKLEGVVTLQLAKMKKSIPDMSLP